MKIVIDVFGGDYSPEELVKGAVTAVNLIEEDLKNNEQLQTIIKELEKILDL